MAAKAVLFAILLLALVLTPSLVSATARGPATTKADKKPSAALKAVLDQTSLDSYCYWCIYGETYCCGPYYPNCCAGYWCCAAGYSCCGTPACC